MAASHEAKLAEEQAKAEAARRMAEVWQSTPLRAQAGKEKRSRKIDNRWNAYHLPAKKGTPSDKEWEKWPQNRPLTVSNENKIVNGPWGHRAVPILEFE